MRAFLMAAGAALMLLSCGPRGGEQAAPDPAIETTTEAEGSSDVAWTPVDAALLSAPTSAFMAIEPSEMGVIASDTVEQAIEPLTSAELGGEGGALHVSVRQDGDNQIADIVRTDVADDSIQAAHVRLEFIPAPEGWFPVNAWRRQQCRRGAHAGSWSATPCP